MASRSQSELAMNVANILDLKGYVWIEEIATWIEPLDNGTFSIVATEAMKRKMFTYLHKQLGEPFTEGKLQGIFRMAPMLQTLRKNRLHETHIAFKDGLLDCDTFEFETFPEMWDKAKTYKKGDTVRFGEDAENSAIKAQGFDDRYPKFSYTATKDTDDRPPSSSLTQWSRHRGTDKVAFVVLPMTYEEALAGTDKDAPHFHKFLNDMFVDHDGVTDPGLVDNITKMLGYVLMPHMKANKIFMLAGPSASNGKSTFLSIIKNVMPDGSYLEKKFKEFASSSGQNYGKADLIAKRLVICNEESSKDVDSGLLKEFSDGLSEIQFRRLYQEPGHFLPTFKIITAFNSAPEFDKVDKGLLRRMVYIPCLAQFDGSLSFSEVTKPIYDERQHILAFMVRQAKELHNRKWKFPEETKLMQDTKTEMLTEQNSTYEFLYGRYIALPKGSTEKGIPCSAIYADYEFMCKANGRQMPFSSRKFFSMAPIELLGGSYASNGVRYRKCKTVTPPVTDPTIQAFK
jgi:hypothetical protein